MEQVTAPPDHGRASTSAMSDDAAAHGTPSTIGMVSELASTIGSSVASAVDGAASAAAVRAVAPPVVPATTVASIAAGNLAASILGPRDQMERMFAPVAAAAALANVGTPFAEIGRWHKNLMRPWVNPIESVINNSFSRMWERPARRCSGRSRGRR